MNKPEHIVFVTGKLAQKSLERVIENMAPRPFSYEIRVLGVTVAALLTTALIARRIGPLDGVARVIVPGRCRGALEDLASRFGVHFERGPEELKDLPEYFGSRSHTQTFERHDCKIFAEIVDAPELSVDAIIARARAYRRAGADVIDIGCLPDTPFPHLADTVGALKEAGFAVSVDSLAPDDLCTGAGAGADYLFSLNEDTLWIAEEAPLTPIVIGRDPRDLDSLYRAIDALQARARPFYADPILDPIHYGFSASLQRYHDTRSRYPEIEMIMGIGNLSELTHADSVGVNTLLLGICSELNIRAVLTTQVSPHCRRAIAEIDLARRILFAAHEDNTPPRHLHEGLMALHERKPHPYQYAEIAELAAQIKDANFRIQTSAEGIHVYNRDGLHQATDPYDLYPLLEVDDDAPHAFYLGLELARAEIAWRLGKRYEQDAGLQWGCAVDTEPDDKTHFAAPRSTLKARRRRRKKTQ